MLAQLEEGLRALGEDPAAHPCDSYLAYLDLLEKWNRTYNLSGIKDKQRMLSYHLLDSISALQHVQGTRALDVGSGAGLPGLVLALARPARQWVLLDSNGKKTRFLQQAVMELGMKNVEVVTSRLEEFQAEVPFDTITSRALMAAAEFCRMSMPLLAIDGRVLMFKGPDLEKEIAGLDEESLRVSKTEIQVPGVQGQRYILRIENGD